MFRVYYVRNMNDDNVKLRRDYLFRKINIIKLYFW